MHQDTPEASEALQLLVESPGDNPSGVEALQRLFLGGGVDAEVPAKDVVRNIEYEVRRRDKAPLDRPPHTERGAEFFGDLLW